MSVTVTFSCDGCDATEVGTDPLRAGFVSLSGREYGIGSLKHLNTVKDVCPPGWIAYDPYTFATYCPRCWGAIEETK